MQVPLAAYRAIDNDRQYLDVWRNGKRERVLSPFLPYMFSKRPLAGGFAREERVTVRPLSTLEPEVWHRYEFNTVRGVSESSRGEEPLMMADNHVAFVERVIIDEPDFFKSYPNTDELRLMYVDVEQLSSGKGFPTEKDPLIAIAWACGAAEPACVMGDGKSDRDILQAFLDAVNAYDPDVFVGYNIGGYDLTMIMKRLAQNGMSAGPLARGDKAPELDDGDDLVLTGRLIYDVYESVKLDQTLFGIKDRKLKTVGEWMGYPVIREDTSDLRALVGTDRLREYNVSDVVLTRNLANIYWKNFVALAEFYGAPLNVVMRATPQFHTTILQGRVFHQASPRIVSDGKNEDRYRALYDAAGGQAFVGGIVEIYQRGLFQPIYKVDFSSMYPSIMVSLGCGADNTRLLGTEPIGPFLVEQRGETRVYHIPDESRDCNLVLEIKGVSPMAEQLKSLLRQRLELKKLAKQAADPLEKERLHARQNVMKVVLNAIYGVMASSFARYGSLPVAVATVGVARRLIRVVEGHLGDAKIETDTDGVYSAAAIDSEAVNDLVARFVERELGGDNYMRLEVEEYKAGYFHQRKSYLLLHKDGRIEKHGVAFKGSSLCGVFDKTLDRVSQALLTGGADPRTVGRQCFEMDAYAPEDFVMRVRLGKSLEEYAAANAVGAQVARAYEKLWGRRPEKGEQLEYLKTSQGYEPPTPEAYRRLEYPYYKDMVANVLERLDIDWRPQKQKSLMDF